LNSSAPKTKIFFTLRPFAYIMPSLPSIAALNEMPFI
jgi:hypothetical protein